MNNSEVVKKIQQFIVWQNLSCENNYSDMTIMLESAREKDICFYDVKDDPKSIQSFLNRLSKSNAGLTIIPDVKLPSIDSNIISVERSSYLEVQKILADVLYPTTNSKLVGVTGTNGKTTTVYLAMQLAFFSKNKAISVGTLGLYDQDGKLPFDTGMTTPSYIEIRKILFHYGHNYQYFFFEVSSHALEQERFYKLNFEVAAWTSFSQDHLDYHKNMESYFASKCKIFAKTHNVFVPWREKDLINKLSSYGNQLRSTQIIVQKLSNPFWAAEHNKSNLEIALSLVEYLGMSIGTNVNLDELNPPPGRFQPVKIGNSFAFVDYAHTPDALENILSTLRISFPNKKIISVFGCGGDRDKTKRPLMGAMVERYSDVIIVTSDNPRSENPEAIIDDILTGINAQESIIRESDRRSAIQIAVELMNDSSVLLLAGKGHEDYQEIQGIKYPFDDYKILKELSERKNVF